MEPPCGRSPALGARHDPARRVRRGRFCGALYLACGLRRAIRAGRIELTIVSRDNFQALHGFSHEMLSGKIQPGQIISPARRIFPPARFRNAEIEAIDIAGRTVTMSCTRAPNATSIQPSQLWSNCEQAGS
jgi:NADH dehydrogenase FAD-containing subunit